MNPALKHVAAAGFSPMAGWDTCAPQAVIEAYGGALLKLSTFAATGGSSRECYTYEQSDVNLDFEPGVPLLTPYNAARAAAVEKGAAAPAAVDVFAQEVSELKPYANVCGLLALTATGMGGLDDLAASVAAASQKSPPKFT